MDPRSPLPDSTHILNERLLGAYSSEVHEQFLLDTATTRLRYRESRRMVWRGIGFFILPLILVFVAAQFGPVHAGAYVALVIILCVLGYRLWKHMSAASEAYDAYSFAALRYLTPVMSTVLGRTLSHLPEAMHHEETVGHLTTSQLFTDRIDTHETDDCYQVAGKLTGSVRELKATRTEQRGKQSVTITLFSGLFGIFTLPRTLTGATYISTEGDGSGFAHRSFWTSLTESGEVKETELESNAFERDLHVASTDPVEARYILTPNAMASLHDWWLEHKSNIRIAFKGNQLYIALPDTHIVFSDIPTDPTLEDMQKYLTTTLVPLWRIVSLTEQVRL
jgi:hypothetical protein